MTGSPSRAAASKPGPRNAEDRLRHLLIMLPWLMEVGEVPLSVVAERFGLTERQVTKDLELVAMCGLPPYVDEMVDVFVDDGMVFVGVPRLFTRPLRLTAPEGFALLAAGRAAMELPGHDPSGPLARGLAKLADVLGGAGLDTGHQRASRRSRREGPQDDADQDDADVDDTAGVAVDLERPALADEFVDAVGDGAEVDIEYYSPARGETRRRVVVPRHVFADGGNWYVLVDYVAVETDSDGAAVIGERRTLRVDRVESFARTGRTHSLDPEATAPSGFFVDADLPRARLRLAPGAQWIVDRYPIDSVQPVKGARGKATDRVEVVLPIASPWWLNRLLIRLGPDAQVIEPPDADLGARQLAERILANYDA